MPSVTNPFTSGTPLASATANNRYPLSNALFANSQPTGVPTSYNFTLTNLEIAAVNAGIAQIHAFYTTSSGLIVTSPNNNYGLTPTQITALNTVTTYFSGLSAGNYNIPQATLSAIVIVSEMHRAWPYYNLNQYTQAEIVTASGIMLGNPSVVTGGTGFVPGTYTDVAVTGGSGTDAYVTVTAAGGVIASLTITSGGSYGSCITQSPIAITGGSGTGATCSLVMTPGVINSLSVNTPGSGYTNGTYAGVPLIPSGASGSGGVATIVITSGQVSSATLTTPGTNYGIHTGSSVTFSNSYVGGSGSGALLNIGITNIVSSVTVVAGGSGYYSTDKLSISLAYIGSADTSDTDAIITCTASAVAVTAVTLVEGGFGYVSGDTLSVLNTNLDSPNGTGFTFTPTTFSSTAIVEPNAAYPLGATTIVSNDGYFIVEQPNTGNWFVSSNQNGVIWNAITQAQMQSRSDTIVAVDSVPALGVVLFGTRSMEFWYDEGTSPFQYQRLSGQMADWGLAAKWSRAYIQNSIVFLGQNYQGECQIMILNGYVPTRISTSDIENLINGFDVNDDAIAYSFILDGHAIYRITFPTANHTYDFDSLTGLWNESMSGLTYPYRHLTTLGISYNSCNYASDCVSGSIYYIDPANYTDNGSYIYREVDSVHINNGGNEFGIDELFLDMQLGTTSQISGDTPAITMQKSVDGGNTFNSAISKPIGTAGSSDYTSPRVIWRRLGMGRDFVFKFITQSAVPFIISQTSLLIRKGTER